MVLAALVAKVPPWKHQTVAASEVQQPVAAAALAVQALQRAPAVVPALEVLVPVLAAEVAPLPLVKKTQVLGMPTATTAMATMGCCSRPRSR